MSDSSDREISAADQQLLNEVDKAEVNESAMTALLEQGANPFLQNENGATVFMYAAAHDLGSFIAAVISEDVREVDHFNILDQWGNSALFYAASSGNAEVVSMLRNNGAIFSESNYDGLTPLMIASLNGHDKVVNELLRAGAVSDTKDARGNTALMMAAAQGNENIVGYLLEFARAYTDAQNSAGEAAFHMAVGGGHVRIVELLLRHGASVNLQNSDHRTPLMHAAAVGGDHGLQIVDMLLNGVKKEEASDRDHRTPPMHTAAVGGDHGLDIAPMRANVEVFDREGHSALSYAAMNGHTEILSLLVERSDADLLNRPALGGLTPLMFAAMHGHAHAVHVLLEAGAILEMRSEDGLTALDFAAQHGNGGSPSEGAHPWLITPPRQDYDRIVQMLIHALNYPRAKHEA